MAESAGNGRCRTSKGGCIEHQLLAQRMGIVEEAIKAIKEERKWAWRLRVTTLVTLLITLVAVVLKG